MLFFSDVRQYGASKIMQNSRQYSFISDIWTIGFKPNSPRKELSMGHDKDRLQRSLCDFEWHNSKNARKQLKYHLEINID